jgi:hypothetical protein
MVKWIQGWACPYCKEVYTDYLDAESCAEECADILEPLVVDTIICEVCGEDYVSESDAIVCEEEHEVKNDLLWRDYLVKKNFDELKKAASVPGQTRLGR